MSEPRLHAVDEGSGAPVVLLHGFTGCAESLDALARALQPEFRTLRVDLLGHGRSPAPRDEHAWAPSACAAQLEAVLDARGVASAHFVGYSMGGRVALALAVSCPARVRSLALIGASAGIADPAARAERVRADRALAARIEEGGVAAFVDDWMALPLFASQRARLGEAAYERARRERLANRAFDLAASLRGMGTGAWPPLHAALPGLALPVLLLAGAEDAKFAAIARELASQLPDARVQLVPDAGHAAHLENPAVAHAAIRDFLAASETARAAPARPAPSISPTHSAEERP